MCALVPEPKPVAKSCSHNTAEPLGADADAVFLRCTACGQILVLQGGRAWTIRSYGSSPIAIR